MVISDGSDRPQDITERKRTEEALRHSEERLRLITNLVPLGIFAKHAAGRHIFANPALVEFAGLPVEEILGKDDFDLVTDRREAHASRRRGSRRDYAPPASLRTGPGRLTNWTAPFRVCPITRISPLYPKLLGKWPNGTLVLRFYRI
jgi:PAS domain-containing protein